MALEYVPPYLHFQVQLPQIIKGIKTKKTDDLSIWLILALIVGLTLWIIYGIGKNDIIIATGNTVSVSFNVVLLFLKIKYSTNSYQLRGSRHKKYKGFSIFSLLRAITLGWNVNDSSTASLLVYFEFSFSTQYYCKTLTMNPMRKSHLYCAPTARNR